MSSCRAQTLIAFSISDVEIHAFVAAIGPVVAAELEALEVRVNTKAAGSRISAEPGTR